MTDMSVYKELIPNHYVGDFVSVTISCRQKDKNHLKIMTLETEIDQLLRKLFFNEPKQALNTTDGKDK